MTPLEFAILRVLVNLIIVVLTLLIARTIWGNYKTTHQTASLMLFIYMILLFVAYSEQALIVILKYKKIIMVGSQAHLMLSGICFIVGTGIAAAAATVFAILILRPRHTKVFCIPPILMAIAHSLIWAIFGQTPLPAGKGVVEWFPSLPLKGSVIAMAIMAFVPAVFFLVYGIKTPTFRQKVSGITLGIGFLTLGYFVFISDNFSIAPSILYRRICIALGVFVVYLGFVTPRWYLKLLRKERATIEEG
ncbi:MAG TPA: hypothetical protein HA348_03045 [Thermoplasmata archaeon]|nr:hypothetical protein [Thermoplasmata archaeon]